jgi:hypothetical protein
MRSARNSPSRSPAYIAVAHTARILEGHGGDQRPGLVRRREALATAADGRELEPGARTQRDLAAG